MIGIAFDLTPVDVKPSRKFKKGSKYDPIIDEFIKIEENLATVEVEGKECNYLRSQLKKRIDARSLEDKIRVSVVYNKVYLEK